MKTKGIKFLAVLAVLVMAFAGFVVISDSQSNDATDTTTYYVSATGNDANTGTSVDSAFATVAKAIQEPTNNIVVNIIDSITENVTVPNTTHNITIQKYEDASDSVMLTGTITTTPGYSGTLTVNGIGITASAPVDIHGVTSDILFENVTFIKGFNTATSASHDDIKTALLAFNGSFGKATVKNCSFSASSSANTGPAHKAILAYGYGDSTELIVTGCTFKDFARTVATSGVKTVDVESNTVTSWLPDNGGTKFFVQVSSTNPGEEYMKSPESITVKSNTLATITKIPGSDDSGYAFVFNERLSSANLTKYDVDVDSTLESNITVTLSSDATIASGTTLTIPSGSKLVISGNNVTNAGTISVSGSGKIDLTGTITNTGTIALDDSVGNIITMSGESKITASSESKGKITVSSTVSTVGRAYDTIAITGGTIEYQTIDVNQSTHPVISTGEAAQTEDVTIQHNTINLNGSSTSVTEYGIIVGKFNTDSTVVNFNVLDNKFTSTCWISYAVEIGDGDSDDLSAGYQKVSILGNDFAGINSYEWSVNPTKVDKAPVRIDCLGAKIGTSLAVEGVNVAVGSTVDGLAITAGAADAGALKDNTNAIVDNISVGYLGIRKISSAADENGGLEVADGATLTITGKANILGTLVNNGTITNTGTITNGGTISNTGKLTNSGDLINQKTMTGDVEITFGHPFEMTSDATFDGTVSYGDLSVTLNATAGAAGLTFTPGSIRIEGSMSAESVEAQISAATEDVIIGDLEITSGTLTLSDNNITVDGNLTLSNTSKLVVSESITIQDGANLNVTSTASITVNAAITNEGSVSVSGTVNTSTAQITNFGNGEVLATGSNIESVKSVVTNQEVSEGITVTAAVASGCESMGTFSVSKSVIESNVKTTIDFNAVAKSGYRLSKIQYTVGSETFTCESWTSLTIKTSSDITITATFESALTMSEGTITGGTYSATVGGVESDFPFMVVSGSTYAISGSGTSYTMTITDLSLPDHYNVVITPVTTLTGDDVRFTGFYLNGTLLANDATGTISASDTIGFAFEETVTISAGTFTGATVTYGGQPFDKLTVAAGSTLSIGELGETVTITVTDTTNDEYEITAAKTDSIGDSYRFWLSAGTDKYLPGANIELTDSFSMSVTFENTVKLTKGTSIGAVLTTDISGNEDFSSAITVGEGSTYAIAGSGSAYTLTVTDTDSTVYVITATMDSVTSPYRFTGFGLNDKVYDKTPETATLTEDTTVIGIFERYITVTTDIEDSAKSVYGEQTVTVAWGSPFIVTSETVDEVTTYYFTLTDENYNETKYVIDATSNLPEVEGKTITFDGFTIGNKVYNVNDSGYLYANSTIVVSFSYSVTITPGDNKNANWDSNLPTSVAQGAPFTVGSSTGRISLNLDGTVYTATMTLTAGATYRAGISIGGTFYEAGSSGTIDEAVAIFAEFDQLYTINKETSPMGGTLVFTGGATTLTLGSEATYSVNSNTGVMTLTDVGMVTTEYTLTATADSGYMFTKFYNSTDEEKTALTSGTITDMATDAAITFNVKFTEAEASVTIGETTTAYTTLAQAIDVAESAQSAATVTLLKDVTAVSGQSIDMGTVTLVIPSAYTLTLGGAFTTSGTISVVGKLAMNENTLTIASGGKVSVGQTGQVIGKGDIITEAQTAENTAVIEVASGGVLGYYVSTNGYINENGGVITVYGASSETANAKGVVTIQDITGGTGSFIVAAGTSGELSMSGYAVAATHEKSVARIAMYGNTNGQFHSLGGYVSINDDLDVGNGVTFMTRGLVVNAALSMNGILFNEINNTDAAGGVIIANGGSIAFANTGALRGMVDAGSATSFVTVMSTPGASTEQGGSNYSATYSDILAYSGIYGFTVAYNGSAATLSGALTAQASVVDKTATLGTVTLVSGATTSVSVTIAGKLAIPAAADYFTMVGAQTITLGAGGSVYFAEGGETTTATGGYSEFSVSESKLNIAVKTGTLTMTGSIYSNFNVSVASGATLDLDSAYVYGAVSIGTGADLNLLSAVTVSGKDANITFASGADYFTMMGTTIVTLANEASVTFTEGGAKTTAGEDSSTELSVSNSTLNIAVKSGTLTMTGPIYNNFDVNVDAGTLVLSGSSIAGPVDIASDATLKLGASVSLTSTITVDGTLNLNDKNLTIAQGGSLSVNDGGKVIGTQDSIIVTATSGNVITVKNGGVLGYYESSTGYMNDNAGMIAIFGGASTESSAYGVVTAQDITGGESNDFVITAGENSRLSVSRDAEAATVSTEGKYSVPRLGLYGKADGAAGDVYISSAMTVGSGIGFYTKGVSITNALTVNGIMFNESDNATVQSKAVILASGGSITVNSTGALRGAILYGTADAGTAGTLIISTVGTSTTAGGSNYSATYSDILAYSGIYGFTVAYDGSAATLSGALTAQTNVVDKTVTLNTFTVGMNATLAVSEKASLTGTITNNGTVIVGGYTLTDMTELKGTMTFDGEKTITASAESSITWGTKSLTANENGAFTYDLSSGALGITAGTVTLDKGEILSVQAVTVSSGATFAVTGATTLSGSIESSGIVKVGDYTLTDMTELKGTMTFDGTKTISASAGSSITWGTKSLTANENGAFTYDLSSGALGITAGTVTLTAAEIYSGQTVTVSNGATFAITGVTTLSGSIENSGTVTVGEYTLTDITELKGTMTFDGQKTITASAESSITWGTKSLAAGNNGAFKCELDTFSVEITAGMVTLTAAEIYAGQAITVDANATLDIVTSLIIDAKDGTTAAGKITAVSGGIIKTDGTIRPDITEIVGPITYGSSTITATEGGKITWGTKYLEAGADGEFTYNLSTAALSITDGIVTMSAAEIYSGQAVTVSKGATFNYAGTTISGTVTVESGAVMNVTAETTNNETVTVNTGGSIVISEKFTNTKLMKIDGTLTIDSGVTFTNSVSTASSAEGILITGIVVDQRTSGSAGGYTNTGMAAGTNSSAWSNGAEEIDVEEHTGDVGSSITVSTDAVLITKAVTTTSALTVTLNSDVATETVVITFPSGITIPANTVIVAIETDIGGYYAAYEIKFEGITIPEDEVVTITTPVKVSAVAGLTAVVYYINNSEIEAMETTIVNNYVTFTTTHNSTYAVAIDSVAETDLLYAFSNAVNYVYSDYTYNADIVISGTTGTFTYSTTPSNMNDLARFLGALYRQDDGSTVKTIVFDDTTYTWDETGTLKGSNWEDESGNTLVSAIESKISTLKNVSLILVGDDSSVAVTLNLVIESESTYTVNIGETTLGDSYSVGDVISLPVSDEIAYYTATSGKYVTTYTVLASDADDYVITLTAVAPAEVQYYTVNIGETTLGDSYSVGDVISLPYSSDVAYYSTNSGKYVSTYTVLASDATEYVITLTSVASSEAALAGHVRSISNVYFQYAYDTTNDKTTSTFMVYIDPYTTVSAGKLCIQYTYQQTVDDVVYNMTGTISVDVAAGTNTAVVSVELALDDDTEHDVLAYDVYYEYTIGEATYYTQTYDVYGRLFTIEI